MKRIKNIIMYFLIIGLMLPVGGITQINANQKPIFSTTFIDYDITQNGESGRGDNPLIISKGLDPGQAFQVDLNLEGVTGKNMNAINLFINYDSEVIEPLFLGGTPASDGGLIEPYEMKDNDFFPKSARGSHWSTTSQFLHEDELIIVSYRNTAIANEQAKLVDNSEKRMNSLFFRVKNDAPANSHIEITYGVDNRGVDSNYGDGGSQGIFVKDNLGTIAQTFVKGEELPPSNTKIDHISMTGNTGKGQYDYLDSDRVNFSEDQNLYEVDVPNSVKNINFDKILGGVDNKAEVVFGRVDKFEDGFKTITDSGLSVGNNNLYKASVKDLASGEVVKMYDFRVNRLNNIADFDVSYTAGSDVGTFGSSKDIELKSGVNSVNINASSKDKSPGYEYRILREDNTAYPGDTSKGYTVDTNRASSTFKVEFTPEEARSIYDNVPGIDDNRAKVVSPNDVYSMNKVSNDTSIESVTVKDSNSTNTYNATTSDDTNYTTTLPGSVTHVDLDILLNDLGANVMTPNLNRIDVSQYQSPNKLPVKVNAADGTEKTYYFTFNSEKSSDASLKSLSVKVNGDEKNYNNFNNPLKVTNFELDFNDNYNVDILGVPSDSNAKIVSGNISNTKLKIGNNKFDVIVEAEDKTKETYTVNLKVNIGGDLDVKDEGDWIDPNHPVEDNTDKDETEPSDSEMSIHRHTVYVKHSKTEFSLSDLEYNFDESGQVTPKVSKLDLKVGENIFEFTTESFDKTTRAKYIITVIRAGGSEIDGDLGIKDDDWVVDPDNPIEDDSNFNETDKDGITKIFRYNLDVKYSKDSFRKSDLDFELQAGAVYESESADPLSLNVGNNNEFIFKVKSSDGKNVSKYIITINRQADQNTDIKDLDIKDGDSWLSNPDAPDKIVDGSTPGEILDGTIKIYRKTVYVKNNKQSFGLSDLSFVDNGMTTNILTTNPIHLQDGSNNQFIFERVNSDKSSTSRYIITVVREALEVKEQPTLDSYSINNGATVDIPKFQNYVTINLDDLLSEDATSFEFKANAKDTYIAEPATKEIDIFGMSVIYHTVVVSDETEGTVNIYTFKFTRTLNNDSDLEGDLESDLDLEEGEVIEGNPKVVKYSVTVNSEKDKFYLDDLNFTLPKGATLKMISKNPLSLDFGNSNKFIFEVISEDGSQTTRYEITVNRLTEQDGNTDSDLDGEIEVNPGDDDWLVDPDNPIIKDEENSGQPDPEDPDTLVYKYTVRVKYEKSSFYYDDLNFKLPTGGILNKISPSPMNLVIIGETGNLFEFSVVSGDGSSTTKYEITVIREPEIIETGSDDSEIEDLDLNDDSWLENPDEGLVDESIEDEVDEDDESVHIYRKRVVVENSKDKFGISDLSFTLPEKSSIRYITGRTITLGVIGEPGQDFIFEVVSENGKSTSRYIITVVRAEEEIIEEPEDPADSESDLDDPLVTNPDNDDLIEDPMTEDDDSGEKDPTDESVTVHKHTVTVKYEKDRWYMDDFMVAPMSGGKTLNVITKNPLALVTEDEGNNLFIFEIVSANGKFTSRYEVTIIRKNEVEIVNPEDDESKLVSGIMVNPGARPQDWVTVPNTVLPEDEGSGVSSGENPVKTLYKHTVTVKYEKDSFYRDDLNFELPKGATLNITSKNPLPLITGSGNTFTFETVSANGKYVSVYEITVIRQHEIVEEGSEESDILGDLELNEDQDFMIDDEDIVNDSIEDEVIDDIKIYRYSINVKNSKTRFYLSDLDYSLPAHASERMVSKNPLILKVGSDNKFIFEVVSESGLTVSQYIITINREALNERPFLIDISIDDVKYDAFDKDESITEINLDGLLSLDATNFTFKVTASDNATATKQSDVINVKGLGEFERTVTVVSDDGELNMYLFKFTRTLGSDNNLSDIIVDEGNVALKPEFSEDQIIYEVEVDADSVHVEGISKDKNATITGDGDITLKPGKNLVTITVTPEDNGPAKEYVISVIRPLALEALSIDSIEVDVSSGVVDGDTITYDIGELPSDVRSAFVYAKANHSSVTFAGDANKVVSFNNTQFTFSLTTEDQSETLNVIVKYSRDNTDETGIDNITVDDGKTIWVAEKDEEGNYQIVVDKDTNIGAIEDKIKVELEVSGGEVSISAPTDNPDGSKDYKITVKDKNGNETEYDLNIKNSDSDDEIVASDNNYLKSITYNGNDIVDFDKLETEHSISIGANEALEITAEPEDPNANVMVGPEKDGKVEIIVISENGLIRKYRVIVVREDLSSTSLENLKVLEANMTPAFKPNLTNYYVTIPNELDNITIEYLASEGVSSVSVTSDETLKISEGSENQYRVEELPLGETIIHVDVKANSGTIYTYNIHVTRNTEANNLLDDLKILDQEDNDIEYKLSTPFNSKVLTYSVLVPNEANNFTVDAVKNDLAKEITAGVGEINIADSDFPYIHEVRVVDSQNVVRIYTVTFIKAPSEDPRLANITTDQGALDPIFESDVTTYSIDVPYEVVDINLIVTKISQDQTVEGDGVQALEVGINTFEITVTAGNETMTYTIQVNRIASAARLDWLTVSEGDLSPEFSSKHIQYRVGVPFDTESIVIDAGSDNPKAEIIGIGEKDLEEGINIFKVTVKVTEEDFKVYYVVVDRAYENEEDNPYKDDLSLIYLSLENENLNEEFDPELYAYTSKFENKYPEGIDLVAIAINPEADVSVDGNSNIIEDNHKITITVSLGELSQETTITINVDDLRLMSDIHEVGEEYIATVKNGQTVLDVMNQMLNPNEHLRLYKNGELMETTQQVGTGVIIKLVVNEKEYDAKTIVVLGDINGDGDIRINDFMSVQNHLLGTPLVDDKFIAADINKDDSVRINDFMGIQNHLLKISDIHGE